MFKDVHKFGGSCLKDADGYRRIGSIDFSGGCILVVSASYGTTKALRILLYAAANRTDYSACLDTLIETQYALYQSLLGTQGLWQKQLSSDQQALTAMLECIVLLRSFSDLQRDWGLSYGEYWSSRLLAAMIGQEAQWLDAATIIHAERKDGLLHVGWEASMQQFNQVFSNYTHNVVIVPGFVAQNKAGQRITLGDNGTDFSAAIFAKLAGARGMHKWTDVDGIFSADPRLVHSAFAIEQLSYAEASELAYFGTAILHPQAAQPVIEENIPLYIKNFYAPENAGTRVGNLQAESQPSVKGLSSIAHLAMLTLEGTGMMGVSGVAARLFDSLSQANISVILISQASSEQSISVVVADDSAHDAKAVIEQHFALELQRRQIECVHLRVHCSVIAAVGDGMQGKKGFAASFFTTLANANINILAIAQGSSERNISVVVDSKDTTRALRSLHGGFYLSYQTLSVGLIGPGGVGQQLLEQIQQNLHTLRDRYQLDLRVRGIASSRQMLLSEKAIDLDGFSLRSLTRAFDLESFVTHIASPEIPHAVIIDCTASQDIAQKYAYFVSQNCHVITPNKKANSDDYPQYQRLMQQVEQRRCNYLYETTVCAGLPVIKTIKDLLATGDTIKKIEGIVSGTLAYIFNQCAKGHSFADSVLDAYEKGYTKPDPRDDLNGLDVARKFVCLGRELGFPIGLEEVRLLNLVPEGLEHLDVADFLQALDEHQADINVRIMGLLENNAAIAYVGVLENGEAHIQLKAYDAGHPFANSKGTDNILMIQSARYDAQPLIIQGPGAGADVTAAGVFADILQLAAMI